MFWCIRALLKLQNFHGSTSRSTVFVNVSSLCLTVHEKDQHIKMLSSRRVQGLMIIQIHHQYHYGPCVRLRPILPCRAAHFVPATSLRQREALGSCGLGPADTEPPAVDGAGTRGHRAAGRGLGWEQRSRLIPPNSTVWPGQNRAVSMCVEGRRPSVRSLIQGATPERTVAFKKQKLVRRR